MKRVKAVKPPFYVFKLDFPTDWSDHGLYWPEKSLWLLRTKSTLDQYGVQADCRLWFTPMHKTLQVMLPDLQVVDMQINFSINIFRVVVKICKELGKCFTDCSLRQSLGCVQIDQYLTVGFGLHPSLCVCICWCIEYAIQKTIENIDI